MLLMQYLTNLIQGIVAPETCGIGGDLFALIWVPGKNKPEFLDASVIQVAMSIQTSSKL